MLFSSRIAGAAVSEGKPVCLAGSMLFREQASWSLIVALVLCFAVAFEKGPTGDCKGMELATSNHWRCEFAYDLGDRLSLTMHRITARSIAGNSDAAGNDGRLT